MHRIVSLLPSATEIVCALGLRDQLVGVSHECDYPAGVGTLPKVTRTLIPHTASSAEIDALVRERLKTTKALYNLDLPTLEALEPTLIVTQALCDVCAVAEAEVAAAAHRLPGRPTVVNLEPMSLAQVFECLTLVGAAAGIPDTARTLIADLQARVDAVEQLTRTAPRPGVVLLEWIDPPFCSGHWSPELVHLAGGTELLGAAAKRSQTSTWSEIRALDPEVLLIACCGFDLARTRTDLPILARQPGFFDLRAVRSSRTYMVDGNAYFSRPGPRLVDSLEILAHALHPDRCPRDPSLPAAVRLSPADFA